MDQPPSYYTEIDIKTPIITQQPSPVSLIGKNPISEHIISSISGIHQCLYYGTSTDGFPYLYALILTSPIAVFFDITGECCCKCCCNICCNNCCNTCCNSCFDNCCQNYKLYNCCCCT
jgi:hypothetical protein